MDEEFWLDYELPEELIAHSPAARRDESKLMFLDRRSGARTHGRFFEIEERLHRGDVLVINDTAVFPARLRGAREGTGGKVEALLLEEQSGDQWQAMLRCGGRLRANEFLNLGPSLKARLIESLGSGLWLIELKSPKSVAEAIEDCGEVPLPPYIEGARSEIDHKSRYQTVYASQRGAVAAPTAGLHFTAELLDRLSAKGVDRVSLTLHVGPGTFQPIRDDLASHVMHSERYWIPEATLATITRAKAEGRRIIAVGTTSVRALESYAATKHASGATKLFVTPPYEFKIVEGLITNFHLPRSTLLLLVSAFAGTESLKAAYAEAIAERYRFYSYGDAMFIA